MSRRGGSGAATLLGPDRDNDLGPDDWWGGQSTWARTGTACAAMFVALLLICAAIIGWSKLGGGTHPPAATEPLTPGSARATAAAAQAAHPAAGTLTVTWQRVGIGALPFSSNAGPRSTRAGVPRGFSHDSSGAVLAAAQILGRLSWAAQSTTTMLAVADVDTTPAAQARAALTYAPPTDPTMVPAVVGYHLDAVTAEAATVELALRFSGTLHVAPVVLAWANGDWKLAGAPGPLTQTDWAAVADLTGFTAFSGQPSTGS